MSSKKEKMSLPCIGIKRHDAGVYEWALLFAEERVDGDVGETSITDCLKAAIAPLSPNVHHVEIKYRGVHMGTFRVAELAERPDLVADHISEGYAALF
jgi:hypothetical protein